MKKIVVLGAGFGGLQTASGLSEVMKDGYEISLIDERDAFFIGFSKIDVLFGRRTEEEVSYRYDNLRADGVRFVKASITAIDTDQRKVETSQGSFGYDYLVVALGAELNPGATPGFEQSGSHEFYSMAGASRLRPVLQSFSAGKLVLGILGMPYKCPPAPYEVGCQMHDLFVERGVRDQIEMSMVIPGPRAVPNPNVADALEGLLKDRNIHLISGAAIQRIDSDKNEVIAEKHAIPYDLFVGVPAHRAPAVVRGSKLGAGGYIQPNVETLETSISNVYAVGDVTKLPVGDKAVPKAGAFAEDAARTVVSEILVKEGLATERVKFEAKGACYFEVGAGRVAKVTANFFGGDKPKQKVDGPSAEFHSDKLDFENTRRARWFK